MNCTRTNDDFLRLQTISYLYRGYSRTDIGEMTKIGASTLRRWIAAFNIAVCKSRERYYSFCKPL